MDDDRGRWERNDPERGIVKGKARTGEGRVPAVSGRGWGTGGRRKLRNSVCLEVEGGGMDARIDRRSRARRVGSCG
jgi:hypothetical protein